MSQPPAPPRTIAQAIEDLQKQIEAADQEVETKRAELHRAELKRSNLLGQLQAYASLQQVEPANPATVTNGSEA